MGFALCFCIPPKGNAMSFEGTWDLTIPSPMGSKTFRLEVRAEGGVLRGTSSANGETHPMTGLREDGGRLCWSMQMPRPMNVVLDVEVALDGDALAGSAKAGRMPLPNVRGERVGTAG
jgi:hypothetical protein